MHNSYKCRKIYKTTETYFTAQTAQAATALDATQQYAAAHPYTG